MIFANQNLRIHVLIAITFWLLAGNTLANFEKQSNSDVDIKKIAEQISKKIQVSETEQKWINANHSIRYWVSTEAPPYFYDKKQPVGLAIDYAKIVCATYNSIVSLRISLRRPLASLFRSLGLKVVLMHL